MGLWMVEENQKKSKKKAKRLFTDRKMKMDRKKSDDPITPDHWIIIIHSFIHFSSFHYWIHFFCTVLIQNFSPDCCCCCLSIDQLNLDKNIFFFQIQKNTHKKWLWLLSRTFYNRIKNPTHSNIHTQIYVGKKISN